MKVMEKTGLTDKAEALRKRYFSDESQRMTLKKGEILLHQSQFNDKLFLVEEGSLSASVVDDEGDKVEIFRCLKNQFVGVHSFFSEGHTSFSTVVAEEDSSLAYIDLDTDKWGEDFPCDFLPIIIYEVYLRQVAAEKLTQERQRVVKKLQELETLTMLGKLAAGIAHELNNAIGVLQRNTWWLSDLLSDLWKEEENHHLFEKSKKEGSSLSGKKIRKKKKKLEKQYNISPKLARHLAKANLTEAQIRALAQNGFKDAKSALQMVEAGVALHDMSVAAAHSTHVVRSVRELGNVQRANMVETSLVQTMTECLILLKDILRPIQVVSQFETSGKILVSPGDLVQVWLNLVKNAAENMLQANTENPRIVIRITEDQNDYRVSVSNNGPQIKPEILPKIFEPSFTTKVDGLSFGLGLGLSIVKKIVQGYQGTISVESEPQKTVFAVRLPKK
jgi:signal transduction histidine kinase